MAPRARAGANIRKITFVGIYIWEKLAYTSQVSDVAPRPLLKYILVIVVLP
jgi:hypothetical protein